MDIEKAIECLQADKEYLTDMKICDGEEIDIAIKELEEVQQYREIGTVEECRDAIEKQIPKKIVRIKLRQSEYGSPLRCPVCESDLIPTEFFNEYGTESDEKISWCSGCGQKLDWNK